jgi:hypothetical protein
MGWSMGRKKKAELNWGDLVVALIDEITPYVRDPANRYQIVSLMVSDLLSRRVVRPGENWGIF